MDKSTIVIAEELARLSGLTIFELRGEWRRLHRMPPPMRLSRDLLTRGITYKLQERAYGGLSKATAHKLEQAGADPLSCGAAKGREHARRPQRGLDRDAGDVPGGAARFLSFPRLDHRAVGAAPITITDFQPKRTDIRIGEPTLEQIFFHIRAAFQAPHSPHFLHEHAAS